MSEDRIEQEITIAAPLERVWEVLTEPVHVGTWFGTGVPAAIDLRPGGVMVLDHGEYGRYSTVFVTVEPPRRLSYRWASGFPEVLATEENSTLVEFSLEDQGGKTLLRLVESGFDRLVLPPGREEISGYESHVRGWLGVLERLGGYAEGTDDSPLVPPR